MRVSVHPCDRGGCGWYRILYPAQVLADAGHDVVVADELEATRQADGRPFRVHLDADVVVLQRPLQRQMVEAIPVMQRHGVAVVVEVDDDFHALPKGHGARRATSVAADPDYNRRWLRVACEQADLVTVTTPALAARYGGHGRVVVLPNLVPEWYMSVPSHPPRVEAPTVGWTGSVRTHVGDLEVMGGVVPGVLAETGARFVSWGVGLTEQALGVKGRVRPWAELTGAYPRQVADLDVGLVPLADNDFNRAKSALKMSEYLALGVPCVISPSPDNLRLHEAHGVGVVAHSPEEWRTNLVRLLASPDLRSELAAHGREVMAGLTYERHADRWLEAWRSAAEYRSGGRMVA